LAFCSAFPPPPACFFGGIINMAAEVQRGFAEALLPGRDRLAALRQLLESVLQGAGAARAALLQAFVDCYIRRTPRPLPHSPQHNGPP
jgi:hypothetical protein